MRRLIGSMSLRNIVMVIFRINAISIGILGNVESNVWAEWICLTSAGGRPNAPKIATTTEYCPLAWVSPMRLKYNSILQIYYVMYTVHFCCFYWSVHSYSRDFLVYQFSINLTCLKPSSWKMALNFGCCFLISKVSQFLSLISFCICLFKNIGSVMFL